MFMEWKVCMNVYPINYNLELKPNLAKFVYDGKLILDISIKEKTRFIEINILELVIDKIELNEIELEYEENREDQILKIDLNEELTGEIQLRFDFRGEINDKLAGIYRSKYFENDEGKYVAVSQMQESDARRAFPCFDSPEYKSTYEISYLVPDYYDTISNTSIEKIDKLDNGYKRVYFEKTPKMSSYLVFIGFGDFEFKNGKFKDIPLRIVTAPGKSKYTDLAMDYGEKSLSYCEDYFDIEYPLSKMDMIATPDFAAGAMENWGAILYRENALLDYPGVTTNSGKMRIKSIIAHEIAHQWFGNLVSPNKWKYVWLNESFATYFASKTIEHYEPEYGVFEYYVLGTTNFALSADGYDFTAPIEQIGDEKISYTVRTTPIMYSKGGSVLRQLEAYLGHDDFKDGLRYYLKKHEYDIAESEDLWESFEYISKKQISKFMDSWVKQLGYPVIKAIKNNNVLVLSQSRFTYIGKKYDTLWDIPISLRQYLSNGEYIDHNYLMETENFEIHLDANCEYFKLNIDHNGFYRVFYDKENYRRLLSNLENEGITNIDVFNIENDLYAMLISRQIQLDEYIDYLSEITKNKTHMIISSVISHLNSLYEYLSGDLEENVRNFAINYINSLLNDINYEKKDGESHTITMLRGRLINLGAKLGSDEAIDFCKKYLIRIEQSDNLDQNILPSVLAQIARDGNDFDFFDKKYKSAESEAEKQYYSLAMFNFSSRKEIEKLQEYLFEEIPARNRGSAIEILCSNPYAKDSIWEWYLANLDNFEKLHNFIYQRALTSVIVASVKYRDDVVDFFDKYMIKNPQVLDPVKKALETLDIRSKFLEFMK